MDEYEATRIVHSRIQSLDPENASKIMGLLLLQDHGDKEMIRLAFGPETLLHSIILKARNDLGLVSPSGPHWSGLHGQDQLIIPNNGSFTLNPASTLFTANGKCSVDASDDFELYDCLSFLDDFNPRPDFTTSVHGRSGGFEGSDLGLGWGTCSHFARGTCNNGVNCSFVHGSDHGQYGGFDAVIGSPVLDTCHELVRSTTVPIPQNPRLAHHFIGGGSAFPFSPKRAAAALMMGDDLHKLGRYIPDRSGLSSMASPARQIYLTFPADSSFREEDVSTYFSTYGPVQDVRIPYQQKRMFGFVTFVYPETVKSILARGNPHFVCDSRVLVKPYKEKGKVPDKHRAKQTCPIYDSMDSMDLQHAGGRSVCNNSQEGLRRKCEEELMNLQLLDDTKPHLSASTHSPNPFNLPLNGSIDNQKKAMEDHERSSGGVPAAAAAAHETNQSGSSSPSSDSTCSLSEPFESFDTQFPRSFTLILLIYTCFHYYSLFTSRVICSGYHGSECYQAMVDPPVVWGYNNSGNGRSSCIHSEGEEEEEEDLPNRC